MNAFTAIEQNKLALQLMPISVRELLYLSECPCNVYTMRESIYTLTLKKGAFLTNQVLKDLIKNHHAKIFVKHEDRLDIISQQQDNLRQVTRSLSIGDPLEKGRKQINLLTINMRYLYENPTNDETLNLQFQSVKNLASFLLKKPEVHEPLYRHYLDQKHHFIFAQPLLSSLFVLGLLKQSHLYSDREIEQYFLTSYFKDVGMSAIPTEKYDQEDLSPEDKILLTKHAKTSVLILEGRVQLSPNHMSIIKNHHMFSLLTDRLTQNIEKEDSELNGFETMVISIMDVIAAMITERPYRNPTTLFESLELVKLLVTDQYPQEFRMIVSYFKTFFLKK